MLILAFGAIFMLAISIFIHELGHLLCGMLVGVKARIFSIGYGRGIWKKKIGETTYQITGIPFGGYVMFKGDEYGKKLKGEPGELLSTPPLKRMIPVLGGPFANLVLGFVLLFVLELTGSDSPGNRVFIDSGIESSSPAFKAGLRSDDVVVRINDQVTENFEDIFTAISLSKGDPILVTYWENGEEEKEKSITVVPNLYSSGGRPTIGIEPAGERRVVATFTYSEQISEWMNQKLGKSEEAEAYFRSRMEERVEKGEITREQAERFLAQDNKELKSRAIEYLNDGDVLLAVNGVEVYTITDLQRELGKYRGKSVNLKVDRKTLPLLNPWATQITELEIPVMGADVIEFRNLKHTKFRELDLDTLSLASYDPEIKTRLKNLKINGESFPNSESLVQYLNQITGTRAKVSFDGREYTSDISIRPIGLLGFRPSMKFQPETQKKDQNIFEAFVGAGSKVYQNVATSLKGIGMLFSGLLSPKENLSGPIGIVQFAGMSLEYGWRTYLDFVAKISIALMIMNLLPIPVADGGHIVMYAYEAIAGRPLPKKVMEAIFRIGFFFLIGMFIYVSFNDALRIF